MLYLESKELLRTGSFKFTTSCPDRIKQAEGTKTSSQADVLYETFIMMTLGEGKTYEQKVLGVC